MTDLSRYRAMQKQVVWEMERVAAILYDKEVVFVGICSDAIEIKGVDISNFVGVLCSSVKNKRNKTTVVLLYDSDGALIRGSLRGKSDSVDYLKVFESNGVKVAGHKSAFGIISEKVEEIDMEKLSEQIGVLEGVNKESRKIIEVSDMSVFNKYNAKKVAANNMFVRSPYMMVV